LIEPIEIFLADRQNDPDYFTNSDLDYGYVILEGHQRRLAAMIAGVPTVTCIEITDESMLVKLKVKHRKLRRQLSENNLRKD
jgi:ParB-like chromosome segregation protein Spo0J